MAGPTTVVTQVVASKGVPAPVVLIGLPAKSRRQTSTFLRSGLPFSVSSDKKISDVEIRLIQLLPKGRKRPLGVELVLAPGKLALTATVLAAAVRQEQALPAARECRGARGRGRHGVRRQRRAGARGLHAAHVANPPAVPRRA